VYMNHKTRPPRHLLPNNSTPVDTIFHQIYNAQDQDQDQDKKKTKDTDWISEETYNLFRWKAMARKRGQTQNSQGLSRLLKKRFQQDCQNQITRAATNATTLFEQHDTRAAYHQLCNWYKTRQTKPSNPTNKEMDTIWLEYKELYTKKNPSSLSIRTYVNYDIQDTTPTEQEIVQALSAMQLRKAPGASRISVEQIRKWFHHAKVADNKCQKAIEIWDKILSMVFSTGQIPKSFYNGIMVLYQSHKIKASVVLLCLKQFTN
jgi:hypothetical protein